MNGVAGSGGRNHSCSRCSMHLGIRDHSTEQHDEALQKQLSNFKKESHA